MAEVEEKKKRTFRKFTYRSIDLDQLLDMSCEQLMQLYSARQRQRLNRGLWRKQHSLLKAVQGQERRAAHREARGLEDAPTRHDHSAPDGGQHGGRLQQQDLKPGGNQA
ncbi:hypothetical protein G4228_001676 [Cervus hanglu yarkandensis]|nr:hypothetical protein G4228_001676 [Cervus hanglu yarkandensis]